MLGSAKFILLAGALVGAAGLMVAQVPPTSVFQLDGNSASSSANCAYDTGSATCDYWNLLNGAGGANVTLNQTPPTSAGHWVARTFINGISGASANAAFQGGGSKDPNPLSQWKYATTPTPNKDALNASYAAGYQKAGHFVLVFGADRLSANGDANIGTWFFQSNVTLNGGSFVGTHKLHDLFVISSFTTGGGTSTISVYEWDQPNQPAGNTGCASGVKNPKVGECADTNLRVVALPTSVCGSSIFCAITNSATTATSWDGNVVSPTFFEGGMDVTAALAAVGVTDLPCFSSFLMETRSSQSTSSVLKDFVLGGFNVCGMTITKTCAGEGVPGASTVTYTFNGTVTNIGIGSLQHVTVVDTLPANTSNVAFKAGTPGATLAAAGAPVAVSSATCPSDAPAGAACVDVGSLPVGYVVKWSVSFNEASATSGTNTAIAAASSNAGATSSGACSDSGTVCSTSSGDSCSATVVNTITISKSCGVPQDTLGTGNPSADVQGTQLVVNGSVVAVKVNYSGTITNSGTATLTGITVTDVPGGAPAVAWPGAAGTLLPGASASYAGTYTPSSISSGNGTGAGRYGFSDEIYVTNATASFGNNPPVMKACTDIPGSPAGAQSCDGKTCNICFGGSTGGLCNVTY